MFGQCPSQLNLLGKVVVGVLPAISAGYAPSNASRGGRVATTVLAGEAVVLYWLRNNPRCGGTAVTHSAIGPRSGLFVAPWKLLRCCARILAKNQGKTHGCRRNLVASFRTGTCCHPKSRRMTFQLEDDHPPNCRSMSWARRWIRTFHGSIILFASPSRVVVGLCITDRGDVCACWMGVACTHATTTSGAGTALAYQSKPILSSTSAPAVMAMSQGIRLGVHLAYGRRRLSSCTSRYVEMMLFGTSGMSKFESLATRLP